VFALLVRLFVVKLVNLLVNNKGYHPQLRVITIFINFVNISVATKPQAA